MRIPYTIYRVIFVENIKTFHLYFCLVKFNDPVYNIFGHLKESIFTQIIETFPISS